MSTVLDDPDHILKKVRTLLADPKCWTQGAMARTADGAPCSPNSKSAACWCIEGAIEKATRRELTFRSPGYQLVSRMLSTGRTSPTGVHVWNDDKARTHAEVLEFLDYMITTTEAKKGTTP